MKPILQGKLAKPILFISRLLVVLLSFISLLLVILCCLYYYDTAPAECDIEKGCLNDALFTGEDTVCTEAQEYCPMTLADLTQKDFDQVIFLRKYQYDLSKNCGTLNIRWWQRLRFSEHCDYLIYSNGDELTDFVRGLCFSASTKLSGLDNNVTFKDKNEINMVNQAFNKDQKVIVHNTGRNNGIDILVDYDKEPTDMACMTEFLGAAP